MTQGAREHEGVEPANGADGRAEPEAKTPTPDLPEAYVIPRALAQATLEYLAAQPYREVFALVRGFEALEPVPSGRAQRVGD